MWNVNFRSLENAANLVCFIMHLFLYSKRSCSFSVVPLCSWHTRTWFLVGYLSCDTFLQMKSFWHFPSLCLPVLCDTSGNKHWKQYIYFSSELLKPFFWCHFNKFLAGEILNNFSSSWSSCCNMIISFITKIALLLSSLISKMCTILTIFPAIWVLFGIPFPIRLLLNQHPLLLHFQMLLKEFYQYNPLFMITICLFTQLWQQSCYSIITKQLIYTF